MRRGRVHVDDAPGAVRGGGVTGARVTGTRCVHGMWTGKPRMGNKRKCPVCGITQENCALPPDHPASIEADRQPRLPEVALPRTCTHCVRGKRLDCNGGPEYDCPFCDGTGFA